MFHSFLQVGAQPLHNSVRPLTAADSFPFLPLSPGECWLSPFLSCTVLRGKLANMFHCWSAGGFVLLFTVFNKSELVANIKKIVRFHIKKMDSGFS